MPRIAIACLRSVKTGSAVGGNWQMLEGLPGDRLIVTSLQNIRPDTKVTALPAEPAGHDAKLPETPTSPSGM